MTIEQGWEDAPEEQYQGADAWSQMRPMDVRVVATMAENVAPEATTWMTFSIPATGGTTLPIRVCPHSSRRYKAKFLFTALGADTIYIARVQDYLTSNALGTAFMVTIGAALTQSTSILPDYDGAQPLYMISKNGLCGVSVMDETYKTVQ
jgi:hypothetical protein